MAATKRKSSIIFFLWPATMVAAFFFGRLTQNNDPTAAYQATLALAEQDAREKAYEVKKASKGSASTAEDELVESADVDPLLQIRSAITENDPLKRMSMLTDAFSKLTKDNIMDGVALLDSMPDSQLKRQMESLLYNTWGKLDGPAAMEYVNNLENSDNGDGGRGGRGRGGPGGGGRGGGDRFGSSNLRNSVAVMSGWAEADPKNAVTYAAENGTSEGGRNVLMMSAMQGWANTDIEGAINYAMTEIEPSTDQGRGRGGGGVENFLISRYANDNPQAAAQWALSQSDPNVRKEAVGTLARSMASDNPQEAAQWAQMISDPEAQSEAVKGTASGWARQDPKAAMDWALTIEDSATSSQAASTALSTWAREDPYSASDYVISMEAGAEKDQAASTLSRNLVRQDPEMALLWAESITDPNLQMQTLAPIANGWMQKDTAKATEWIQSSSLPEETKQALLKPKKP